MKSKFMLLSTGEATVFEIDGKTMGKGVSRVSFCHDENGAKISLDIDLDKFEFMNKNLGEIEKALKESAAN